MKTTRSESAAPNSAQTSPATEGPDKKEALRGESFATQEQMLAPGEAKAPGKGLLERGKDALKSALDFAKDPKEALYGARLGMEGRQEAVLGAAHEVSNQDVVMEQLAHKGAYGSLDNRKLAQWGYREMGAAVDPESGFRAVLFMPTDEALTGKTEQAQMIRAIHGGKPQPVLAFRGTAEKRGMQDDTNRQGVGAYQFASNEARVREMLGLAGGKVIVTGHSLGGALAQLAATHFPSAIARVCTFQSPGIPKEEAAKLDEHNKKAAPEDRVASTHHRAEGDMVHMAGEALTEGDVFTYKSVGMGNPMDHMTFPLARLSAARGDMVPGVSEGLGEKGGDRLVGVDKTTTRDEKSGAMPKIAEGARKGLGGAIRDDSMETYGALWKDVKTMIDSKAFGRSQILGIIAASPVLKPEQKIKMRDAATKLLPPTPAAPEAKQK